MITEQDRKFLDRVGPSALSSGATLNSSFELAERAILENISGNFVECGVFAGAQSAAMARAIMKHKSSKKVHLFDSFEGIPMAGPNDDQQPGLTAGNPLADRAKAGKGTGELKTSGVSACSVERVKSFMANWGVDPSILVYHKGWFENVLPKLQISDIAILRLDGDLYSSSKVCLKYLYPKVKGFVIIDDYPLVGSRKACDEYFKAHNIKPNLKYIQDNKDDIKNPAYFDIRENETHL